MAKTVSFNGQQYDFPDDATDDEISSILDKHDVGQQENTTEKQNNLPFLAKLGLSLAGSTQRPLKEVIPERMSALGRGVTEIGQGAKQAYLLGKEGLGLGNKGDAANYTEQVNRETQGWNKTPAANDEYNKLITEIPKMLLMGGPLGVEGNLLKRIITSGIIGGVVGGLKFDPTGNNERIGNATQGAAINAALPLVPEAPALVGKALNELRPTNLLEKFIKTNLGKKELLRNLEVTKGTSTGLGDRYKNSFHRRK
jgi:hypothetical protein